MTLEGPKKMSPEAKKLMDKSDGFHLTKESARKDEKAFEKRMRLDLPHEERDASPYGHENVRGREAADIFYAQTAKERNSYRSLLQKMFGLNKVTSDEAMRDDADRLNVLVDTRLQNDATESAQQASDAIVSDSSEFRADIPTISQYLENERRIGIREFVKNMSPRIEQLSNEGNIKDARKEFEEGLAGIAMDSEERGEIRGDFYHLFITDKLESILASKDRTSLERAERQITEMEDQHLPINIERYKEILSPKKPG